MFKGVRDDDDLPMGSGAEEATEDEDLPLDFGDDEGSKIDLLDDSYGDDGLSLLEGPDNEDLVSLDRDVPGGLIEYDGFHEEATRRHWCRRRMA